MADDEYKEGQQDEYSYSESDYTDAYAAVDSSQATVTEKMMKFFRQQRIVLVVVALVIIYVIIKIASHMEGGASHTTKTPPKTTVPSFSQPVAQHTQAAPRLDQRLNKLHAHQQQVQQHTQQNFSNLDRTLQGIQQSLNQLNLNTLGLQRVVVAQMNWQRSQEEARMSALRKKAQARYHVQAVVPERAWVVGPRGRILTVVVGSQIPGAGVVKLIDPRNGVVVTNTGTRIEFQPD